MAVSLGAGVLARDILRFDADALAQREDDRADHRDEQDQAGGLEEESTGVEHPRSRRVGHRPTAGAAIGRRAGSRRVERPRHDQDSSRGR
jgi:hypothetical protein